MGGGRSYVDALTVGAIDLEVDRYRFFADNLDSPTLGVPDWVVDMLAPATVDTNNAGMIVRAFDDATEEGVAFSARVPLGAVNITLRFNSRPDTAPGAPVAVIPNLYLRLQRGVPPVAVGAWSGATALAAITFPALTEFFQEDTQTLTLASLGMTAGNTYQFELTRSVTGTLVDDWFLYELEVLFT